MIDIFSGWALGKALDAVLDNVQKKKLSDEIDNAVSDWCDSLPKEARLPEESLFYSNRGFDNSPARDEVASMLKRHILPGHEDWLSLLLERFDKITEDPEGKDNFFQLERDQAEKFLSDLAHRIRCVCILDENIFKFFVFNTIDEHLSKHREFLSQQHISITLNSGVVNPNIKEKYSEGGRYNVRLTFTIDTGESPIILNWLSMNYYVHGIFCFPSSNGTWNFDRVFGIPNITSHYDRFASTGTQIKSDKQIKSSIQLEFYPPFTALLPTECEKGDVVVKMNWKIKGQAKSQNTQFIACIDRQKYGRKGVENVDTISPPPKFGELHLKKFLDANIIPTDTYEDLMNVRHTIRYMEAFAGHPPGHFLTSKYYHLGKIIQNLRFFEEDEEGKLFDRRSPVS